MPMTPRSTLRRFFVSAALIFSAFVPAGAQPVHVQHTQGALHGFLVIRSGAGTVIGYGELSQIAEGDRITSHLVYHFRDGSVDDETAVFTQHDTFQLVSDHHTQTGPFFKKPSDVLVEANGQVTSRTMDKDGKAKVEVEHVDLPPEIANGMIGTLLEDVHRDTSVQLAMIVPSGKGRLVKLDIAPIGEESFSIAGVRRKANLYSIRINLGGVAGVVAPIVGKQPPNTTIWVYEGEPAVFVRQVGQLSEDGPIVSIELAGTTFPHQPAATQPKK
jgi:hypothetical protein